MLSDYILNSHKRCKQLDIRSKQPFVPPDEEDINNKTHKDLDILVGKCIAKSKSTFFALFNSFFTLTTEELVVINSFINKNSNVDIKKFVPLKGISLKEEHYGISAVSLSAYKKDVAYIVGKEHFRNESKNLTCVSVPLKYEKEVIGYLSLSSYKCNYVNGLRVFMECLSHNIEYELVKLNIIKRLNAYANVISQKYKDINLEELSHKEKEVIYGLLKGHSNFEIAQEMYISEATVKTHLKHIYDKCGTKNKTDTALLMLCRDLLENIG